MGSEAPELLAIKDANLRMQREMFRLGDERNALVDSVIVRQEEIQRLERLVERITLERDRAVDRYQLAEDRIDDLEGLIRAYRHAWDGLRRYHDLPELSDDELMDDAIREQRNADREAAYGAFTSCREELLKAVVAEEDAEDTPEPSDIMGYCPVCGDAVRRDEANEIITGGERVHLGCE